MTNVYEILKGKGYRFCLGCNRPFLPFEVEGYDWKSDGSGGAWSYVSGECCPNCEGGAWVEEMGHILRARRQSSIAWFGYPNQEFMELCDRQSTLREEWLETGLVLAELDGPSFCSCHAEGCLACEGNSEVDPELLQLVEQGYVL